jgi:hypothetical protein
MMAAVSYTRDQPYLLVRAIIEAIDRIAPGRGGAIYWSAFERWEDSRRHSKKHQLPLPLCGGGGNTLT